MNNNIIKNASAVYGDVVIYNTTPHTINFKDGETEFSVGTSVKPGDRTGEMVVNAKSISTEVTPGSGLFRTEFRKDETGVNILEEIEVFHNSHYPGKKMRVVGSMIAMNAYPGQIVGMRPAPGFERVPPAEKRMNPREFNVA